MKKVLDYQRCCSCGACVEACPTSCISTEKFNGFYYPKIEESKCINCQKCIKVCPIINSNTLKNEMAAKCYSYKVDDNTLLKESTSGGAFFEIARQYDNGNTVFVGAEMKDLDVVHTLAYSFEEAKKFRKSKYIKSDTFGLFHVIKSEIEKGKQILFSGTPCQNAAIKNYLGEKSDSVLFIDLICHGVPSNDLFKKYISEKRNTQNVVGFEFRCKERSYNAIKTIYKNKVKYTHSKLDDFTRCFYANMAFMPACYQCEFTTQQRVGDITIGDFWGVPIFDKSINTQNGISVVIANSQKGQSIVDRMESIYKKEFDIQTAIKYNGNLTSSSSKPPYYHDAMEMIKSDSLKSTVRKYLGKPKRLTILISKLLTPKIKQKIKKIIKKA